MLAAEHLLSKIAGEVYPLERIEGLANSARDRLAALGYGNVHVRCGDGTLGWPEHAPYDAIITLTAGATVHVCPREARVLLMIGEPGDEGSRSATMSPEQAEMVLHALGLAERLLEQKVRLRGS